MQSTESTAAVRGSLQLLDEEHTALLSAHKALVKRLSRSEAATYAMMDQVDNSHPFHPLFSLLPLLRRVRRRECALRVLV